MDICRSFCTYCSGSHQEPYLACVGSNFYRQSFVHSRPPILCAKMPWSERGLPSPCGTASNTFKNWAFAKKSTAPLPRTHAGTWLNSTPPSTAPTPQQTLTLSSPRSFLPATNPTLPLITSRGTSQTLPPEFPPVFPQPPTPHPPHPPTLRDNDIHCLKPNVPPLPPPVLLSCINNSRVLPNQRWTSIGRIVDRVLRDGYRESCPRSRGGIRYD